MAKKLTVVMIGGDVDERGVYDVDAVEEDLLHNVQGLPMTAVEEMGVPDDCGMEYELGNFVVNTGGGHFVTGVYPYFTADGWIDCEDYGKFYFGGLLLKLDGVWYLADWADPDDNRYEMVTFEEMPSLEAAFRRALDMAMADYRKKTA